MKILLLIKSHLIYFLYELIIFIDIIHRLIHYLKPLIHWSKILDVSLTTYLLFLSLNCLIQILFYHFLMLFPC